MDRALGARSGDPTIKLYKLYIFPIAPIILRSLRLRRFVK